MFCEFTTSESDGKFYHTCIKCGAVIVSSRRLCHMQCKKGGPRITAVAVAVAKWLTAGSPTRTQEQIEEAFAECQKCEYFTGSKESGKCRKCGCYVNRVGVINKIRMATEKCPDGRW